MNITWKNVESTVQPLELDELSSNNGIYLRKNIVKEVRTISNIPTDFWLYEETFLTRSEYGQYIDEVSTTPEYIADQKTKQKGKIVQEYKTYFSEFDQVYGAKFARGLCTTAQINTQRALLQTELLTKLSEV